MSLVIPDIEKIKNKTADPASGLIIPVLPSRAPVTDVMTGSFVQPATTGFLHHAARNNNPGNLKYAGQPGAFKAPDSDFAKFPTIQAGFQAMKRDVLAKMDGRSTAEAAKKINLGPNSTIYDLISVYAPPNENDTMSYATTVASRLGVTIDTKVKDVRDRIDEFAKAMVFVEDKSVYAMLTGAKTANAQGPTAQAQPATPKQSKTEGGLVMPDMQSMRAKDSASIATVESGYVSDPMRTGISMIRPEASVPQTRSRKAGESVADFVLDVVKMPFDYAVEKLSNTTFMTEAGAGIEAVASGQVKGSTMDFVGEEILSNVSEIGKSIVGRGVPQAFNTVVASPINAISRLTYGKSNPIGDFLGGFATEVSESFETDMSRRVKSEEFTASKAVSPEFWMTTVAENIPTTMAFMSIASVPYNSVKAFLGTSKFSTVVASLAGGVSMRAMESAAESEDTYTSARQKGMSDEDAVSAAAETFTKNMTLAGLDAVQIAIALSPIKFKGPGSPWSKVLAEVAKLGVGAVTEGGEEMYQHKIQQEAIGNQFSFSDPQTWESGFIGAAMGVAFQAGGRVSETMDVESRKRATEKFLDDVARELPEEVSSEYFARDRTTRDKIRFLDVYTEENEDVVQGAVSIVQSREKERVGVVKEIVTAFQNVASQVSKDMRSDERGAINVGKMFDDLSGGKASTGGRNWREGYDTETDAFRKKDILEAIASMKSTDKEMSDVLDRAEALYNDDGISMANEVYAVSQNPASSEATKARATTLYEEILAPKEKPDNPEIDPWSPEAIDQILDGFKREDEALKAKESAIKEAQADETEVEMVSDKEATPILEQAKEAYTKAENDVLDVFRYAERGERIATQKADSYDLGFVAKPSTFPKWIPEELRSRKLFDQALEYWQTGTKPKASNTRVNSLLDHMAQYIYEQMGEELAAEYAYQKVVEEGGAKETAAKRARQDFKDRIKRILKGEERPGKLTSGQVSKVLKESKSVEQRAASRQVAFEKREARRSRMKLRTELMEKVRSEKLDRQGKRIAASEYVKQHIIPKGKEATYMYKRLLKRIANASTDKRLEHLVNLTDYYAEIQVRAEIRRHIFRVIEMVSKKSSGIDVRARQDIRDLLVKYDWGNKKANEYLDKRGKLVGTKRSWKEVTATELESVLDTIAMLEETGRNLEAGRQEIEDVKVETILADLRDAKNPLKYKEPLSRKPGQEFTKKQKLVNLYRKAVDNVKDKGWFVWQQELVALDMIDGNTGNYDGPFVRNFHGLMAPKLNSYLDEHTFEVKDIIDFAKDNDLTSIGTQERIGVAAIRQQKNGYEKIESTMGWTRKEVDAVVLSEKEQQLLDMMRATMDKYFPLLQKVMKDLYNIEVQKEDFYFPFLTDYERLAEKHEVHERFRHENIMEMQSSLTDKPKGNVSTNMTKERVNDTKQNVNLDAMEVFLKHMDDVVYLVNVGPTVHLLNRVVNAPEFADIAGDRGKKLVQNYIDTMARKGGAERLHEWRTLDIARRNVSYFIMGYKLSTILIQPTAMIDAMIMVNPGNVFWGMKSFLTSRATQDWVMKNFPQIRERAGGEQAIRDMKDRSQTDLTGGKMKKFRDASLAPMQYVDKVVAAGAAGLGAYKQYCYAHNIEVDFTKPANEEAMLYAQRVVTLTQASSLFWEMPQAMSRGSATGNRSLDKALSHFQTFTLNRASRFIYDGIITAIAQRDLKRAARVNGSLFAASVIGAGIRYGLTATLVALMLAKDEDDEGEDEKFLKYLAYEMSSVIPFGSNIYGAYKYDNSLFPVLDVWDGLPDDIRSALESKNSETRARAWARVMLTVSGAGFGVPGTLQTQQFLMATMPEAGSNGVTIPDVKIPNVDIPDVKIPNVDIPNVDI